MLTCPICQCELLCFTSAYKCQNKHSFDLSKDKYVNLLIKQSKKEFGDTIEMINARVIFFLNDFYKPLKKELATLLKSINTSTILDSGCGTGYYTNYFAKQLPNSVFYGLDISKYAIKQAAKPNANVNYIVGSNQRLPFSNNSFACILSIYAPFELNEYLRILKDDGHLIVVTSGSKHLMELKAALYDNIKITGPKLIVDDRVSLIKSIPLTFSFKLNNRQLIQSLFMMTPYYFKTTNKDKKKLEHLNCLTLTADFIICLYKKLDRNN